MSETKIESATRHIRNTGDPRNGLGVHRMDGEE